MTKSILIVEDEKLLAKTLSSALKEVGFKAQTVRTAEQARKELSTGDAFDLVILDNRLPKGDGLGVLRHIREKDVNSSVILMTAYDSSKVRQEAQRLGVNRYVKKPFDLVNMISFVQELLR